MATYYTLLTKIGQARIANAVALNQKVNLTYMAVGDGNGNPTTPNENQTALVREKYRATINQLTVDVDNPNYLVAELIVPTTVGGWSIYEVGVFDDQNQLIAVANFPATYKPELAEGSGRDLIVRIIIQVSNTSVVTLKIDPAITLASQAWVAANYVKKITVAGGTTGQVLVKKSNANEDFQWVDPTAAVDVNVFSREETQTVATGQTIINLAQLTTDGAAIYIEGIRLRDDQFTVNSPTRLTLATSYPAGTKVTIVQNEETSRNAFMLKANNLSDLTDKAAARVNIEVNRLEQKTEETNLFSPNGKWYLFVKDGDWGAYSTQTNNFVPLPVVCGGTGGKNADEALENLGLGLGSAIPVGVPVPYPLETPPAGWMKCNGSSFNLASYPKLAAVFPSGVLPDLRGEFIRGWDDGRGIDAGRAILSSQTDALQKITGELKGIVHNTDDRGFGAFDTTQTGRQVGVNNVEVGDSVADHTFDSSRVARSATETRPRNLAFNYIVRAA